MRHAAHVATLPPLLGNDRAPIPVGRDRPSPAGPGIDRDHGTILQLWYGKGRTLAQLRRPVPCRLPRGEHSRLHQTLDNDLKRRQAFVSI